MQELIGHFRVNMEKMYIFVSSSSDRPGPIVFYYYSARPFRVRTKGVEVALQRLILKEFEKKEYKTIGSIEPDDVSIIFSHMYSSVYLEH